MHTANKKKCIAGNPLNITMIRLIHATMETYTIEINFIKSNDQTIYTVVNPEIFCDFSKINF